MVVRSPQVAMAPRRPSLCEAPATSEKLWLALRAARPASPAWVERRRSAWFTAGKELADRAQIGGLRTRALRPPLGVEPCRQAKTRRLGRMATPAVLPAAHSTAPLLHRSMLITQLRRDILKYQPIQMVGGEATTTVGQRRSESPLLVQAHRLTLASPAAGPDLKHAGERRSAIHATPVLVKTPAS